MQEWQKSRFSFAMITYTVNRSNLGFSIYSRIPCMPRYDHRDQFRIKTNNKVKWFGFRQLVWKPKTMKIKISNVWNIENQHIRRYKHPANVLTYVLRDRMILEFSVPFNPMELHTRGTLLKKAQFLNTSIGSINTTKIVYDYILYFIIFFIMKFTLLFFVRTVEKYLSFSLWI